MFDALKIPTDPVSEMKRLSSKVLRADTNIFLLVSKANIFLMLTPNELPWGLRW